MKQRRRLAGIFGARGNQKNRRRDAGATEMQLNAVDLQVEFSRPSLSLGT
jgi:hypothetical protein